MDNGNPQLEQRPLMTERTGNTCPVEKNAPRATSSVLPARFSHARSFFPKFNVVRHEWRRALDSLFKHTGERVKFRRMKRRNSRKLSRDVNAY